MYSKRHKNNAKVSAKLTISVAMAAPMISKLGIKKKPKIKIYFKAGLKRVMNIFIKKGIFVAPAAENAEMLTCFIKSKGIEKSVIAK